MAAADTMARGQGCAALRGSGHVFLVTSGTRVPAQLSLSLSCNYQNYCGYRITSLKIADSKHNSNSAVGLILTVTTSSIGAMLPAQCSCPPYSPKYFDPVPSVSGAACRYLSCVSQSYQTNGVIHEVALTNELRTRSNLIPVLVVGCGSAVPQQHTRLNHSI
jgi:hypothetical protein